MSLSKRTTFKWWAADWLSRRRAKEISVASYETAVRMHRSPQWGSRPSA
ncbi:hypothetical protein OG453_34955 [Streptomyces sp. NBC_01381]|nr:hypothetical protein [Streptomyces sp. NBC_01381]MCX4671827.1 hypothetical protein [Streptomyces sp. NBC_01381]